MKNIFLAIAAFLFIFSCRSAEEEMLDNANYVGTWNWMATTGGVANVNETPASTGKTRSITLTADYKYTIKENDAVVNEGTYSLSMFVSNTDHLQRVYIDFSNYPDKLVRTVTSTELFLYDDTPDGFDYHYTKN